MATTTATGLISAWRCMVVILRNHVLNIVFPSRPLCAYSIPRRPPAPPMPCVVQGAAECTFEIGQGSTLTVLFDERLYKKAKAAAADAAEQLRSPTNTTPQNLRQIREDHQFVGVQGDGDGGGGARARAGTTATTGSDWEMEGGGFRAGSTGPLYNSHCEKLLDQFVKTQMLSHYLSEGIWEV